jgi:hypothetical protein
MSPSSHLEQTGLPRFCRVQQCSRYVQQFSRYRLQAINTFAPGMQIFREHIFRSAAIAGGNVGNNTEVIGSKWPIQPNILYADRMTIEAILAEIDSEIARLTEARRLLGTADSARSTSSKRSPKKSAGKARKTRVLSADARKRIADAQKRRWAAQKSKSKKDA